MNNVANLLDALDDIVDADLSFIQVITNFIYQNKLLLLLAVAPILLVSIKVLRRLFKL